VSGTPASLERPAGRAASLALGSFFALLYVAFLYYLPRGGYAEFAYYPPARFPFDAMHGFTFEQLALHLGRLALLGPALLGLGYGVAGRVPELRLHGENARRWALIAAGISLLLSAVVLTQILRGWALVDDELTYRQQAALLAEGHLGETSIPDWGYEAFTITTPHGFTGKYLFGEPLIQIVGVWLNLPGALHLVLAAVALVLWFLLHRREAGTEVAAWATVFLALSPMWILSTGTGMSHASSTFCVVAAGYGVHRLRNGRAWSGAALAGMAIGFGLTVRLQVMLPMGAVLGLVAVAQLLRDRRRGPLLLLIGTVGAWLAAIALYDQAITGAWWRLPWYVFQPLERYGFGSITNEAGATVHTVWTALRNLAVSTLRFNGWWLGLPLGLVVLALWAGLGRPGANLRLWFAAGLALVAFNFFYYSPGMCDTGPVYYIELLLPGSLLAAHTTVESLRRWPKIASALIVVHLLFGTGTFVAEQFARLARLTRVMHQPIRDALAHVETPALLLYETVPQESLHAGWVFSFPVRYRSDGDAVVTFPRHRPEIVRALRARYPQRHCYYYRVNPATTGPQLLECSAAEDLLARPYELPGPAMLPRATAYKLGFGTTKWLQLPAAAKTP
jgi:hypothetical protein